MQIVLIGNYRPDGQESMQRFAHLLEQGFRQAGYATETWRPGAWLGRWARSTNTGAGKWLGYVDKWIIFPLVLRWKLFRQGPALRPVRFHICDHSNAPYLNHLPLSQTSITCHDVLAIRGGQGHADAHVAASRLGQVLQAWILRSLGKAERLAAVSQLTLSQLLALTAPPATAGPADWRVIHNAFNADFAPMPPDQAAVLLRRAGLDPARPYVLHVGSGQPRKNRRLLLELLALVAAEWQGTVCFAGEAAEPALLAYADSLGVRQRVVSVARPDHATLVALYSSCAAFVFPSLSEGFGWPLIEAQACGAPVIASSVAPMPEVSNGTALHAPPTDAHAFATAFLSVLAGPQRDKLVQQGFANCRRFAGPLMIDAYLELLKLPTSRLRPCF